MAIRQRTNLIADAAAAAPARSAAIPHRDIRASYVALLCLGKCDFEAIHAFRNDLYFLEALWLDRAPSAATLRQRLDSHAASFKDVAIEASVAFLRCSQAPITPLANGLVPPDADVTPMDNGVLPCPSGKPA